MVREAWEGTVGCGSGLKPLPTELVYKENRVVSALVGGGFGKERGKGYRLY